MKCLTVRRPWSNWICPEKELLEKSGGVLPKPIENRTWSTSYRGPLLIHSGKGWDNVPDGFRREVNFALTGKDEEGCLSVLTPQTAPMGIIGAVNVLDVVTGNENPWASYDQFNFVLEYLCTFRCPIYYVGKLGMFDVPDKLVEPYFWGCGLSIKDGKVIKTPKE